MKETSTTTKKVLKAFKSGRKLTSAKLRDMGVANPSATVWYFRNRQGLAIKHDGKSYHL